MSDNLKPILHPDSNNTGVIDAALDRAGLESIQDRETCLMRLADRNGVLCAVILHQSREYVFPVCADTLAVFAGDMAARAARE